MQKEYNEFLDELKQLPPEEIIDKSYEKVLKEDILCLTEIHDLLQPQAKALYHMKNPLEQLYQEWLSTDCSHMADLEYVVTERAELEVREIMNQERGSR